MGFNDEYQKLRKKRLEEQEKKSKKTTVEAPLFVNKTAALYADDIAPVPTKVSSTQKANTEKEDKGRTWFQKGAFEDGYQFGDVARSLYSSDKDLADNFMAGVLGIGEKAVDAGAYVAGLLGGDDFKKKTGEFIAKDLYDEKEIATQMNDMMMPTRWIRKLLGTDTEEDSVFGDKSDAIAQSGGQLAGTIALQSVGVPWYVTSGVTSFGSEAENAFNEGATYGEAGFSAAISAGSEILTEKMFGGSGLGEKGLINLEPLTKGISNKVVKSLVDLGVDMAAEGSEEVVTSVFSRLGSALYKEENLGEILASEEAFDEYLESFIGGAALGGGMNVGKVVNTAKTGRDYRTDLTADEEKVVDKVYNDAIAEAEENGKKLTSKEKAELYESVLNNLEMGYISTDTIEEVLGGDAYKTYKDTIDNEDALVAEYEELGKKTTPTLADQSRYAELGTQIKDIKENSQREALKQQLSNDVYGLVKDSKLAESYNERARKTQAFTADLSQYDAKQQEVIKKAIDSGILNNSNRTHEFVDMVAKISADKGVLFDFANNAKLKETGFAIGGKTINGFVTKDGVTVNIDSHKALNSVVGHEITHVLEGTELYAELQTALVEYAKTKGDYQGRFDAISELYKNVKDADVNAELTADLVGDYLFTDSDFVNRLSTEHRNVFQKIYDEIKYLLKMATAGSKEARELERVKKVFEDAYRQNGKASENTKYSMSDSDGKALTKEQSDYFKDSKMRDENGNLKVMYHGSQNAGFHVFDPNMSDDDTSLFFVDRNDVAASYSGTSETYEAQSIRTAEDMNNFIESIGAEGYEVVEKDGKFTLLYEGDRVADSNTAKGIYEEFCWYEGVGEGDANYKVYLNLTNPLEVDAKGRPWNKIDAEFSQEVYDKYQSLTAEEKAALVDLAEWEDFRIFNSEIQEATEGALASAYEKMGEDCNIYDLFSVAADNFSEDSMRENARHYLKTRDYAQRAKDQGYDGVIFKNIVDNGGYSNGDEGASTVAIAFDSNQIKSVANDKPTGDPDIRYSLSSMANTFYGDPDMSANDFAIRDYTQTNEYKAYVNECVYNLKQTNPNLDEVSARREIKEAIDGIVRVAVAAKKAGYDIYDDASKRNAKDSKGRLLFSSLEPNSDYFTSNDISTICDKRKNFADIYDDIIRAEEARGVPQGKRFFDNVDNYFYLHKLLAEKGLTQPCRQCYVESMRKNLAPMANAFMRLVGETNPNNAANDQLYQQKGKDKGKLKTNNAKTREWVLEKLSEYGMTASDLSVEMLTTEDGLAQLRIQAPMIYEAFNSFYGQSKPKMPKSATPFRFGELTALLTDENGKIKQSLVDKINSTGGFRLQSYSDFQIQNYTDTLQVIFEAGTLGLRGHAYTKVPAFLDATEGTNLKRNISIFMYKDGNEWKLDRNDSFPYTLEEIYDIVNSDKSGNTSIIAVSQNADMSAWIMANDYVGYGIPFHKSGMKMGTVRDTDVKTEDGRIIKGYSGTIDHTRQQTEVWANTTADHKALTKVKNGISIYSKEVGWDFDNAEGLSKNDLIEKNVKAYIDACDRMGYLPKFRDYVMNNGKVLNDVLRYSKELGFVSQEATIEDISFEYKGYRIPYGYYKFLGDFGMFTPDGQASPHDVLSLKNYDFDKAEAFFADSEKLHRNEILQQFSNGEERERYRNSDLTAEELNEIVKKKRGEVVDSIVAPTKRSLSWEGEAPIRTDNGIYGEDVRLEAPVAEAVDEVVDNSVADKRTTTSVMETPEGFAPISEEYANAMRRENFESIDDADAPPETDAPYYGESENATPSDPFANRDIKEVGSRKVKAYMYENPEVKPFFQQEAQIMLGELRNTIKGERFPIKDDEGYIVGYSGTTRSTSQGIAYLLDECKYTYAEIEKGLNAIIEDNGAENNACSKRIEFLLNERLLNGNIDMDFGYEIPPNQDYINLLNQKQTAEAVNQQGIDAAEHMPDNVAPVQDAPTAPVKEAPVKESYEAIRPPRGEEPSMQEAEPRMRRADSDKKAPVGMEERSWYETSTESEAVDGMITPDDIPDDVRFYKVKSNKKTLATANARLERDGYAKSREYFEGRMSERKLSVEDIALGERLIQEAVKAGDAEAVRDLIIDVSILGTELGQRVQALSIIQRLTPEGQLKALIRTVERGKAKGDKAFEGVEVTEDMTKQILDTKNEDGTFDKEKLDKAVEDVKQQIADQMSVSALDYINAWRYLAMLGNPKTHIRNIVSNVAMFGTRSVKNAVARTAEDFFLRKQKPTLNTESPVGKVVKTDPQNIIPNGTVVKASDRNNFGKVISFNATTGKYTVYFENAKGQTATVKLDANVVTPLHPIKKSKTEKTTDGGDIAPVHYRTKTWRRASDAVKAFAAKTTTEQEAVIKGDNKYSDEGSIKEKRRIFNTTALNAVNNFNTNAMEYEDAVFSKNAYRTSLQEYLTANGIKTEEDIKNNPELVAKAKEYALEEARKATFRQDSYFANKISEIEKKNPFYGLAVGSILPFKKTPINIAKTGVAYSPLGFARNIYDAVKVSKGEMDASEAIDHLAQTLTGTSLTLIGFALANLGVLNGAGDDDKEGKYDYQLGKQSYSFNFGGNSYSLSWLSPVAMPLFVGANAYETLVEKNDWDMNVVVDTLAQTLDPLSEMSFLSSLDDVLSSYDSGIEKFMGAGESMVQNYATQFVPTLSSQIASVFDDTKRSTKASRDSGFKFGEETINKIMYKIPGLRNTLAPTTDIWGNEAKQTENVLARGFESFLSPANKRQGISTAVDDELKALYGEVGKSEILPAIPYDYINYEGAKYDMSAKDYTEYKQTYGQTAYDLMERLFDTYTYKNATAEEKADMVADVYDYARDAAKKEYFTKFGVDFTNATEDGVKVYKENAIKGAIEADLPVDEYRFSTEYPEKYSFFKQNGISYADYKAADEEGKRAYSWAYENPGKYMLSKAVTDDFLTFYGYKSAMNDFDAKDANGNTVSGLKKERVTEYINGLDLDYGQKIILYRSMYDSKEDQYAYNYEIIDYLNNREDISYDEMVTILKELGFIVHSDGRVTW